LQQLKLNYIFKTVQAQLVNQVFYYVNAFMVNEMLTKKELCTAGNGFQIKFALSQLEDWVIKNSLTDYLDSIRFTAKNLEELANFLTLVTNFSNQPGDVESNMKSLFPSLNIAQINTLVSSFTTDRISTAAIPNNFKKEILGVWSKNRDEKVQVDLNVLFALSDFTSE